MARLQDGSATDRTTRPGAVNRPDAGGCTAAREAPPRAPSATKALVGAVASSCQPCITAQMTAATRAAPIMLRSMRSSLSAVVDAADFNAADFIVRAARYCGGGAR